MSSNTQDIWNRAST